MIDKKKDVDFIPAIKPEVDEVASYRRNTRNEVPKQSNFNGMLVFSLVLMAIMMGVGGFQMFELQKKLDQSNDLLELSHENITKLQSELTVTTGKSTNAFRSMEAQQKTNVSEIDKLWQIAYFQNRPSIAKIQSELAAVKALDKDFDARVKSFKANLVKITGDFTALSTDMTEVRQNLTEDNSDVTTQVSIVRGQIQDAADLTEGNRRAISSIDKKVREIDEAIKVFDRYRQQVNQQLLNLQNQGQPEAPGTTN